MMLKINKTLPKNKTRESRYRCVKYLFLEGPEVTTELSRIANEDALAQSSERRRQTALHADSARETRNDGLERRVSRKSVFMQRTILATLICGIMPGLMGLGFYVVPEKVSAAGYDITQISTMQEMQPYICDNTTIGQSNTLTDTRDNSTYTVAKLSDGKCWMTQNLKLDLTQAKIATSADSDNLAAAFPENALESLDEFIDDDVAVQFSKSPTVSTQYPGDGNGYQPEYGYYYSWCAATGGTCSAATTNGANAPGSICPKGWRLPKASVGVNTNEFAGVAGIPVGTNITRDGDFWGSIKNPSFTNNILSVNNSTWTAAGLVDVDGLRYPSSGGYYWSGTASSNMYAYNLRFNNSKTFYPARNSSKYAGRTLRCLAADWPSQDVNVVAVRVAPVISIDAVSGMTSEVEPHKVTEGTISATVSANTTYDVLLSTNNTSLTNPENLEGPSIPATSPTNPAQPNTNAWGIKTSTNTYLPIATTPTSFYNTEQYDETAQSTKHTFTIGVSVAPSLPAGEYSTTVTITAVNN